MGFYKTGHVTTAELIESSAANLVIDTQINNIYSYTPSTTSNSCTEGYTVDFSNCVSGEKVYLRIKVSWSGFDASNTSGTFKIRFQGSNYNFTDDVWEWTTQYPSNSKQDLTNLVLGTTSGTKIIETSLTIPSEIPTKYTKCHVGLRSDYSNGTGSITISGLEVIPERYYINSGLTSLKINKNYISSNEIYEL